MEIEMQVFNERRVGEHTYLQVAALGSPQMYEQINGEKADEKHVTLYSHLKNAPVDECLNEWRKLAYSCDVAHNRTEKCDFLVEEDDFGVYLMARVDTENDIMRLQKSGW